MRATCCCLASQFLPGDDFVGVLAHGLPLGFGVGDRRSSAAGIAPQEQIGALQLDPGRDPAGLPVLDPLDASCGLVVAEEFGNSRGPTEFVDERGIC
jgi:hypothetical protein